MTPIRQLRLLAPFLLVGLVSGACGGFASPEGWASPTIDDNRAYVFGGDDIAAVNLDSGQSDWIFPDDNNPDQEDLKLETMYANPVVVDDSLVVASFEDGVYTLGKDNGNVRWEFDDIAGEVVGSPAVANGRVIFGSTAGRVYAVNIDGTPVAEWPNGGIPVGEPVWADIVADGDVFYVATMRGTVMAYSAANGEPVWDAPFETDGAVAALALAPNGKLLVPAFNRHVYLVDVKTGEPVNAEGMPTEGWVWQPGAFSETNAYFGDLEGYIYSLNLETGEAAWQEPYKVSGKVKAAPVLVGDTLVVVDRKPVLTLLNAADATPRGAYPLNIDGTVRASLSTSDGFAYFVTTKGDFWRIDPADGTRTRVGQEGGS